MATRVSHDVGCRTSGQLAPSPDVGSRHRARRRLPHTWKSAQTLHLRAQRLHRRRPYWTSRSRDRSVLCSRAGSPCPTTTEGTSWQRVLPLPLAGPPAPDRRPARNGGASSAAVRVRRRRLRRRSRPPGRPQGERPRLARPRLVAGPPRPPTGPARSRRAGSSTTRGGARPASVAGSRPGACCSGCSRQVSPPS